jgi:hypothetical protein
MNADVFVKGLDYGTPLHRVIIQLIVANHSDVLFKLMFKVGPIFACTYYKTHSGHWPCSRARP